MGFSEQELLAIKSALDYFDEQMACSIDVSKIIDKVNFWIAVEQFCDGGDLDTEFFENMDNVF